MGSLALMMAARPLRSLMAVAGSLCVCRAQRCDRATSISTSAAACGRRKRGPDSRGLYLATTQRCSRALRHWPPDAQQAAVAQIRVRRLIRPSPIGHDSLGMVANSACPPSHGGGPRLRAMNHDTFRTQFELSLRTVRKPQHTRVPNLSLGSSCLLVPRTSQPPKGVPTRGLDSALLDFGLEQD